MFPLSRSQLPVLVHVAFHRVMADPKFELELHHGGQFLKGRFGNEYIGGRTIEGLEFDLDHWPLQELTAILKELGYKGYVKILYLEPERSMNNGLKELKSDSDCMTMAQFVLSTMMKHVELFVVHGLKQGDGIELTSADPDYVSTEDDTESEVGLEDRCWTLCKCETL